MNGFSNHNSSVTELIGDKKKWPRRIVKGNGCGVDSPNHEDADEVDENDQVWGQRTLS